MPELVADRRLLPGETLDDVRVRRSRQALARPRALAGVRVHRGVHAREAGARNTRRSSGSVMRLPACTRGVGAAAPNVRASVAFGTDAGVFEARVHPRCRDGSGIDSHRAHTATEYVEVDQVEAMTDFFEALLTGA